MKHPEYDFQEIEKRWQRYWHENQAAYVDTSKASDKFYMLMMFPYPSGNLHVGHGRNYILGDTVYRYFHMRGRRALNPMGWDAFGLPAENAAIKNDMHPRQWTEGNIRRMKEQFQRWGILYDWGKEIATCDPAYYRWNQYLFLKMLEKDLVYRAYSSVNWCPSCATVLANEQVVSGVCERCGAVVEGKKLEQWYFRITEYADRLLEGLDTLVQWPERVITLQKHWIGRSTGTDIVFKVPDLEEEITVFTTRPDTLYGATYLALAPEHPLAERLVDPADLSKMRQLSHRDPEDTTKHGIPCRFTAIHPLTNEPIPIWIANFVLMEYGTGAIMSVPAHDQRDFEFATQYGIPIKEVIHRDGGYDGTRAWEEGGVLINSGPFDGAENEKAKEAITERLSEMGAGKSSVRYKLRDWLISRQRFWGTPIPVVYCDACGIVPVPEKDLPITLPDTYPTGVQGNPLATVEEFVNCTCPRCGKPARRETDTMDTFVDSSWYYARFITPKEKDRIFDGHLVNYWCPVDLYIGGIEHAILHLLYARFICRVLYDLKLVDFEEPFTRLFTQGMIYKFSETSKKLEKMSKSKGNVVPPDELIQEYGADTERLYTLFIGPPEKDAEWSDRDVKGAYRFLKRLWNLALEIKDQEDKDATYSRAENDLLRKLHITIKNVTQDYESFHFNTVIAAIMELFNALTAYHTKGAHNKRLEVDVIRTICKLLHPMAPHITEEITQRYCDAHTLMESSWPSYDVNLARQEMVTIVVQVNGKLREQIETDRGHSEEEIRAMTGTLPKVVKYLEGKQLRKVIYVKDKLINYVVG